MEQQTKNLIKRAVETLAQTTGIKVVHQPKASKADMAMVFTQRGLRWM